MIHFKNQLLPEDQAKRIQAWLQMPTAREFMDWLSERAAYHTAWAGNAVVSQELGNDVDFKNAGEEARRFLATRDILVGVLLGDIKLESSTLVPKPFSTEE